MVIINKFVPMFSKLINEAEKSTLKHKLSAAIIKGNKFLRSPCSNIMRNKIRGYRSGSLHAEAHAIMEYYGKNLKFKNGEFYCPPNKKRIDLIVIRINKENEICSSRPCHNCLKMMKSVNINKLYYTDNNNNLICENVKDMITIYASSTTIEIETNNIGSNEQYFIDILKKIFPEKVKKSNFEYFVKYDLTNLLPTSKYVIKIFNNSKIIIIYDSFNKELINSVII
jgi:deoxycytidylate deaminase